MPLDFKSMIFIYFFKRKLITLFVIFALFNYSMQSQSTKHSLDSLKNTVENLKLNGNDGPYIINDTLYRITAENELLIQPKFNRELINVKVANEAHDQFYVSIDNQYKIPDSEYKLPKKMIVISDIEGKYNAFESFLLSNKVINAKKKWIFGDGHLVLVGDFVDRGKNVTQVLWLIYKLEFEAEKYGGKVHFILGNHEILNFQGNYDYNRKKYIKAALEISKKSSKKNAVKHLYSERSELGKWMATKNVIEKIGDYLFVHGGLSPELLNYRLSPAAINITSRLSYYKIKNDSVSDFLYSPKGPFWYRGFAMNRLNYKKIKVEELNAVLDYYQVKKIIVGHTLVENVKTDYQGKVIRIDIEHGNTKFSGKTKGLLVENNQEFVIDDLGNKKRLD